MEIHIQLAGVQLGPYSEKQIRDYVAEGLLSMTDKARIDGSLDWIPVDEMLTKLPPPAEPKPAPNPDSIFLDAEPLPSDAPASAETVVPGSGLDDTPVEAAPESKRAPEASPHAGLLPSRATEERKSPESDFTAKTKPLGPLAPIAPAAKGKSITSSKSVSTTAPLTQATKKMSRTALARALQNKTEPLPGRTPAASGTTPPTEVPAVAGTAPETTGPMASGVAAEAAPPPAALPVSRKGAGLPSLLKALSAKTVPMRGAAPAAPASGPSSAPPIPGGSTMPVTTPMPTKLIMNPAANRANRQARPPASPPPDAEIEKPTEKLPASMKPGKQPPAAAPDSDAEKAGEKLPISKKAAELRAKAAQRAAEREAAEAELEPVKSPKSGAAAKSSTAAEPDADLEPVDEPESSPAPKRRLPVLIVLFFALAAACGYYVWSQYHVSDTLRTAMAAGNALDLEHLVDFDSVRASLKKQVKVLAAGSPAGADAEAMLDKSIDVYVTPIGISKLVTKSGQFEAGELDGAMSPDVAGALVNDFVSQPLRKHGLASPTDFVLQTDVANLHLTLHGPSWKLTRIDIRSDLPAPAGAGGAPVILVPVVQTYLNRGQEAQANNDFKTAIADFTQALSLAPQSTAAYTARGGARQLSGDYDGAIKDFTQALAIDPQSAAAYDGRGNARMARNDLDGAIADFTQAVKIDPTMAIAYDNRGNAKSAKNDLDGAIQDFTQAITIDPKLAAAYSDRGLARQANGNLEGAIKDYTDALALKPHTARTYFSRGLARLSENNLAEAVVDFNRALAFDPKIADAYFQRGNAKSALHDPDGAIADFNQTIVLNPKNALAYCSRGVAREDKGDLDGAYADYSQALALDPKIALAYFRRALIAVRKNNPDGAIADTTQALDLDPKNAQAYYYRGFAKFERGNLDGAASDLRLFCEASPRDRFADNARLYLWVIAKLGSSRTDADQDLSDALENGWNNSADDFTAKTAAFLLGRATESDYLTAASSTDGNIDATQHCQAYYFAGMKRLLMGDKGTAADYFQKCIATGKKDYCEYILAQAQLQSPSAPPPTATPAPAMPPPTLAPAPPPVPTPKTP